MEVADRLQVVYFGRENSKKRGGYGFHTHGFEREKEEGEGAARSDGVEIDGLDRSRLKKNIYF